MKMASQTPLRSLLSSRPFICRPCLQTQKQLRSLHSKTQKPSVPQPTPFVPDAETFLTLIGRSLKTHAPKFTTWESLFKLSSPQLKELGIEPARTRRYLLRWREKFRRGEYGIGGDFKHVVDGEGVLRIVEVPELQKHRFTSEESDTSIASTSRTPGMTKLVLNVPSESQSYKLGHGQSTTDLKKPAFVKLQDGHTIVGSYLRPLKGSNGKAAVLKVTEGMWEDRRGHKVHGGERRRAETLHKLRVAERKKNER